MRHLGFLSLILALALCGCSGTDAPLSGTDVVDVTGQVVVLNDAVPVDGGVELTVQADDGTQTAFFLPSFFTSDPIEDNWAIYEILRELEIGQRVRVQGERTDLGILITDVTRLIR